MEAVLLIFLIFFLGFTGFWIMHRIDLFCTDLAAQLQTETQPQEETKVNKQAAEKEPA